MSNTITAYFKGRIGVAESVYQNDYGIVMAFDSIDLPAHFDCYFSRLNQEEALPGLGADNRVTIPNSILANPGNVTIHIPLHTGENDSEVEYVIYFKVIGRARPIDDGTPVQMTAIEQALALLQNPINNIDQIVEEALSFTGTSIAALQAEDTAIKGRVSALETDNTSNKSRLDASENNLDSLDARVTNLATLTEGSTTGDAELIDARVIGNKTYNTLHEAIDTEFNIVKEGVNLLLFDGTQLLPPFNYELYGGPFNGASYSDGVMTIPSGSTGNGSYIGLNLLSAGNFNKILNKLIHVRVEYTDLSNVDVYPYMFTNAAYTSHVKTIATKLSGNVMDYWLTIDAVGMSYIFIGVRVSADSPSQATSVTLSVDDKTAYYVDSQNMADTAKANSNSIETIMSKMPKARVSAITPDSTNTGYFMYSTGKAMAIANPAYIIKVYPVEQGNYYNLYSPGYSLSDETYVAVAFSESSIIENQAMPDEIVFRPSTTSNVVDIDYACHKDGYLWIAIAPDRGEIVPYTTALEDMEADTALNFKHYKKILTIGDSLTNAVAPDTTIRWQNILTSLLNMEGHSRSGAIGLTVADIGGGGSIYSAVQALTTEADVDIISFWGGTNDWSNDVPLGDFDTEIAKTTSDATTFYGACIECVKKIITLYPTKRIFCVGTTPRYINVDADEYSNDTPNNINLYLLDYVDALKKVAEYFGLPFLDLYRTSGINKLNISQYMFMQTLNGNKYYLHFNVNGEYQIAYRMAGFILKIG